MSYIQNVLSMLRSRSRHRAFREGTVVSRFIARHIRREILIVSTTRLDEGVILGRVRTTNVLHLSKGLIAQPEFDPQREIRINEMWRWTGNSWGGLLDGGSIVDKERIHEK